MCHRTDKVLDHVTSCFKQMRDTTVLKMFQDGEKAWGLDSSRNAAILRHFKDAIEAYEVDDRLPVGKFSS